MKDADVKGKGALKNGFFGYKVSFFELKVPEKVVLKSRFGGFDGDIERV